MEKILHIYLYLGAWKADPSLSCQTCPDNIAGGLDSQSKAGTCARTKQDSANKLISYVCNWSTYSADYICQKARQGKTLFFLFPDASETV